MLWLSLVPSLLYLIAIALPLGALYVWRQRQRASSKRSPLTRDLLRTPGQSLRTQLDDVTGDIGAYLAVLPVIPVTVYAMVMTQTSLGHPPGPVAFGLMVLFVLGSMGYFLGKLILLFRKRRDLALGLDAELAVGEELNQLMRIGYSVFHDVPAERFNVDHVVVGPSGVFAVETKGRPKRDAEKGWEVSYDGETLRFPGWSESAPLEQAQRQAEWLQRWLSSAVGEPVQAKPVLALPGWYVNRTSSRGMPVFNGRSPKKLFPKIGSTRLGEATIQRIRHQLDQRCRTVEPKAYKRERQESALNSR